MRVPPSLASGTDIGNPARSDGPSQWCTSDRCLRDAGVMLASAASISPISMRKPRSFTWKSKRPRYSIVPSSANAPDHPCGRYAPTARRERIGNESLRRQPGDDDSRAKPEHRRCTARPAHRPAPAASAVSSTYICVFQPDDRSARRSRVGGGIPSRSRRPPLRSGRTDCSMARGKTLRRTAAAARRQCFAAAHDVTQRRWSPARRRCRETPQHRRHEVQRP